MYSSGKKMCPCIEGDFPSSEMCLFSTVVSCTECSLYGDTEAQN